MEKGGRWRERSVEGRRQAGWVKKRGREVERERLGGRESERASERKEVEKERWREGEEGSGHREKDGWR